jgi:hypothetical protein
MFSHRAAGVLLILLVVSHGDGRGASAWVQAQDKPPAQDGDSQEGRSQAEAGKSRAPLAIPSEPVFSLTPLEGLPRMGRLVELSSEGNGSLRLIAEDGEETQLRLEEVYKLARPGDAPLVPPAPGSLALFPRGDRLRASIGAAGERTLALKVPVLADTTLEVPIDSLVALLFNPPGEPDELDAWYHRARLEPRTGEVLWLANGDRITGGLAAIADRKLSFQRDGASAPADFDRSTLIGLGFDPGLALRPDPSGTVLEITFVDGSRLSVSNARLERGILSAQSVIGPAIQVPLAQISRITFRSNRVIPLELREPAGTAYVGYLGDHPARFSRNSSFSGRTMRIEGVAYDHGLGTRPRTLIAYRIEPGDEAFQATVGLDDRAGPLGSVVFRVLVDGKERFTSGPMTRRDVARTVNIPLEGGQTLILATEFGTRGDIQDEANWVEARIIRSQNADR